MDRTQPFAVLVLVAVVASGVVGPTLLGASFGGTGGVAAADHGIEKGNFTVIPSRQPGLDDGQLKSFGVPHRKIPAVDYLRATWQEGGFTGCGPSNSEAFGIDRGNDNPGTEIDESLTPKVKSTTVTENVFKADFYDEGDFGGSPPTFNEGDEFVNYVTGCIDTPEEPGWYQLQSTIAGQDGATKVNSHYFWVCDCANEQAAREKLGPPPSEPTPTPTPTPTATATPTPTPEPTPTRTPPDEGTPFPSPTPTATATPTPTPGTTPESTSTPAPTATVAAGEGNDADENEAASAATPSPTATEAGNWSDVVRRSPTAAEGPGFGAGIAVVAALVAGLLARRQE